VKKKEMAVRRLKENIEPLIKLAKEEGMDTSEIQTVIEKILNNEN
jgi:DNA-binding transcriptional regulator YhcF (GntR family)